MVSFSLLGLQHPEPNGSRRATPTSTFQHRPGHPPRAEPDRCALHEREQARAAAAEARVQELLNDIRRLRAALRKAGGGKGAREPLPRDVRRLHKALERSQRDKDTIKSLRTEVGGLRTEVRRLRRELQWSENHKETIRRLSRENIELRADLRRLRDQQDTVRSQSDRICRLYLALDESEARNGALKAKLATLLAEKKTLSKPIAGPQLRAALRRSWHQKKTIRSLSEENRRLRRAVSKERAADPQMAGCADGSRSARCPAARSQAHLRQHCSHAWRNRPDHWPVAGARSSGDYAQIHELCRCGGP